MRLRLFADFAPPTRIVLIIATLFTLANSLSGMFVSLFLWSGGASLRQIALYNIAVWSAILLFATPAGALAKRRGAALPTQVGLLLYVLFYGLLLLVGTRAITYMLPLGLLCGAAVSYWSLGSNILYAEVTTEQDRDRFFSVQGLFATVSNLVAPLLSGTLIGWAGQKVGYATIFTLSFGLFLLAALWAFRTNSPAKGGQLELLDVMRRPDPPWQRSLKAHVLLGLRDLYTLLFNLTIFVALGSESRLGRYTFLFGCLTLASYTFLSRRLAPENRFRWFTFGGLGVFAAASILGFGLSWPALLTHALLTAVFSPLAQIPWTTISYQAMGADGRRRRHEYMIAREIPLGLGRIACGLLFLVAQPYLEQVGPRALGLFLAGLGLCYLLIAVYIRPTLRQPTSA
jgi:YQGE family putative transporter